MERDAHDLGEPDLVQTSNGDAIQLTPVQHSLVLMALSSRLLVTLQDAAYFLGASPFIVRRWAVEGHFVIRDDVSPPVIDAEDVARFRVRRLDAGRRAMDALEQSETDLWAADVVRRARRKAEASIEALNASSNPTEERSKEEGGRIEDLATVKEVWQLSNEELVEAFATSEVDIDQWLRTSVPPERAGDVALLIWATQELLDNVRREQIPVVVRRPAGTLGDRSLVGVLREGGFEEIKKAVSKAFDLRESQP